MAPAHPYRADSGTGIEWTPTHVRLWEGGVVTESAQHNTRSPWDYWYSLAYRESFPKVTHWWSQSIWTGEVAVSLPTDMFADRERVTGWMRFNIHESDSVPWTMEAGTPPIVRAPYPPNHDHPGNIILRVTLAHLIVQVVQDNLAPNTWYGVSSLAARDDLPMLLPITHEEAEQNFGGAWRIADGPLIIQQPLRTAMCEALGLLPDTVHM